MESMLEEGQGLAEKQILWKELKVDKKLKLSVKDFYEELGINFSEEKLKDDDGSIGVECIINKSLELVSKHSLNEKRPEEERKIKELKNTPPYPNNYILASLAERSYGEKKNVIKKKSHKENLHGKEILGKWILLTGAYHNIPGFLLGNIKSFAVDTLLYKASGGSVGDPNGYFGAAYWNPYTQQIIIVHRGTENFAAFGTDSIDCIVNADINGIVKNQHVGQIDSAITFTDIIIIALKKINQEKGLNIQLFITGHSLGAWLAPITTFSAKYLEQKDGIFVASKNCEKTGYHASTVIFDGPGCRPMLELFQDKLLNRSSSSLIDSLDITNYLSAPNTINACNPQVGDRYRIFIDLSEEEIKYIRRYRLDISGLAYTLGVMHKICKIKNVFHPETGEVLKDKDGNLRIKKVVDWPSLLSEDPRTKFLEDIANGFAAQLIFMFIPEVNLIWKLGKAVAGFAINKGLLSKAIKWHFQLNREMNEFFELANSTNDFHFDDDEKKEGCITVGENFYRTVRYKTQNLDESYKNRGNLNVFTQPERQFLERYKLLQRYQNVPSAFKLTQLFDIFDQELKDKIIKLLGECEIRNNGSMCSNNLPELIPCIKRMLHFFPKMKDKLEKECKNSPSNILLGIHQSASSSYLDLIKDSLDFHTDNFGLKAFLEDNCLKILHTVQSSTSLGTVKVLKTLNVIGTDYCNDKNHAFFNLDRIFYLGGPLLIKFLETVEHKYLLVIECEEELIDKDDMLNNKIKGFLKKLFVALKLNRNIKAILVTERDSMLSKYVMTCNETSTLYQNKSIESRFTDLTPSSQIKFLEERTVIFQGKEVSLSTIINRDSDGDLDKIFDSETIADLINNKKIEIGKPFPSLGEIQDYYINRKLIKKVKVKGILRDDNLTDLFAISNINKGELSRLVNGGKVRSFSEKDPNRSNPIRFITLNKNEEENNFKKLCYDYSDCTIHWLKKHDNGDLIWQRSHGKTLSGLRRYIENYGNDLSEDEYSEDNTSVKVVDINDISKVDEKVVVVAAEPGMGKTTAFTHLGTQKPHDSKWLILINLVEYKDKLEQRNFNKEGIIIQEVITFLDENNIISNPLAKKLLEFRLYKDGNIFFLLDGFDEITSEGQTNVLNLLKKLQWETKVEKLLISTRLHLRNELENALSTVAYTFKPFFREDQEHFLKKFWKKNQDPEGRLDNYIKKLLKFISNSIGDKDRKFMGIPMQLRMVAEAFQEVVNDGTLLDQPELTFPEGFDMLQLYDRFVDAKYRIYSGKICENGNFSRVQKTLFTKEIKKIHMRLAIRAIFPEMEEAFVRDKLPSKEEEQEMNLVGIVQFINGRVVFTHRTFGEYFVASFLANRLNKGKNSQKYEATSLFLARELFETKNEVVKTFLDYSLTKEEIHVAALRGKLDDVRKIILENCVKVNTIDNLGRSALHYAAQEGHKDIVDILLDKRADIRKTDELGKTALHYAARYNNRKQIVNCLLENAKDCINAKDNNRRTPVYYAAQQGNWDIVDCILEDRNASVEGLDKEKLLFHYTYKGNLDVIRNVVEAEKIDVTATKDNHDNALVHIAAQKGHFEIVVFLLEKRADIGIANKSGKRPISYAAENKHWSIVTFLLEKNEKFNHLTDEQKLSLLKYSAEKFQWNIVKLFIKDNGRYNYFGHLNVQQRVEFLCNSILLGDFNVVEFLMKQDIAINNPDESGLRPICYAARKEYWNIAESLLKKKANLIYLSDAQRLSLLNYSTRNAHWDVVKHFLVGESRDYFDCFNKKQKMHYLYYLISIGDLDATSYFIEKLIKGKIIGDVNMANDCGKTLLHLAVQDGQLNIAQYLVDEKGAEVNTVTLCGSTPLYLAALRGHLEIVKYLVKKGADIYLCNKNGKAPIDVSREKSFKPVEKFFSELYTVYKEFWNVRGSLVSIQSYISEKNNIDINFKYRNGTTLLHIVAREGNFDILKYLLEVGANVGIKDNYGNTVLHWASAMGQISMFPYLLPQDDADCFYTVRGVSDGKPGWHYVFIHKNRKEKFLEKCRTGSCDAFDEGEILCSGWEEKPNEEIVDPCFSERKDYLSIVKYLVGTKRADPNTKNSRGNTILHFIAESGSVNTLKYLFENGADNDLKNDYDSIPLHFASCRAVAAFLVERGSNINAKNKFGNVPLHTAAIYGYLNTVKYLLEEGVCIDVKNNDYETPLYLAVKHGKLDTVKYLFEQGADLTIKNADQKTPKDLATEKGYTDAMEFLNKAEQESLIKAAKQGNLGMVKSLIIQGADVDSNDHENWSPLHFATNYGHLEIVKFLLGKGANALAQNNHHDTVLHLAVSSNKEEIMKLILNKIKETQLNIEHHLNAQDSEGDTPLMWAAACGMVNAAQILLEYGSYIEAKNNDGMTALHWAAKNGHLGVANLLADNGTNIHAIDNNGKKPIHVAALHGHKNVVNLFLSREVSVDDTDKDGWTPLHYAACSADLRITNFLISRGANVNAEGKNGRSPLELAMAIEKVKLGEESDQVLAILGPNSFDHVRLDFDCVSARVERAYDEGLEASSDSLLTLSNTANKFYSEGSFKVALHKFKLVLSLQKRQDFLGPDHPDTLITRMNIAVVLCKLGEYENAFEMLTEVFDLQRKSRDFGPNHPGTLTTRHYIAEVFYKRGKYERALEIYGEVLEKRKEILEANHPDILITKHHIARVLNNQGKHKKALNMFNEIFKLQCPILGTDHPDTLKTHLNIAFTLYRLNKCKEASSIIPEILEKSLKVRGSNHPDHLTVHHVSALVLMKFGEYKDALDILLRIFDLQEIYLGSNHSDTLATKHDIASVLYSQGFRQEALKSFREVYEKRKEVLGPDHLYTSYTFNCIQDANCNIQYYRKQHKASLDLSKFVFNCISHAEVELVKQGLYLPSFEARNFKVNGKCTAITRSLSEALLLRSEKSFLSNLETSSKIYERIAQGKQVSNREEREVFAFSKLLDSFDQQLDSFANSLPSNLIHTKGYKTFSDLSNYIIGIDVDFAIHLVVSNHVVAIYRIGDNYAYFDSNTAFVSGLKSVDELMKVVEKAVELADYKIEEKGLLVEHFDVNKAHSQLSNEYKQILAKEIKSERHLLAEQDKELGFIKINGQKLSRVQLYDLGTKINVEGSVQLLIFADMDLNSKRFSGYINAGKISMSARDYLDNLKGNKNVKELLQATKFIPFTGTKREIEEAEYTLKSKRSFLEQFFACMQRWSQRAKIFM